MSNQSTEVTAATAQEIATALYIKRGLPQDFMTRPYLKEEETLRGLLLSGKIPMDDIGDLFLLALLNQKHREHRENAMSEQDTKTLTIHPFGDFEVGARAIVLLASSEQHVTLVKVTTNQVLVCTAKRYMPGSFSDLEEEVSLYFRLIDIEGIIVLKNKPEAPKKTTQNQRTLPPTLPPLSPVDGREPPF